MVASHAYNPSVAELEIDGSVGPLTGQPSLLHELQTNKRPCLKGKSIQKMSTEWTAREEPNMKLTSALHINLYTCVYIITHTCTPVYM